MRTILDLNFMKGHLGKTLPPGTDVDQLLDAYKKFLALKVICGDTTVPQKFSPSPLIDQVWHRHMMYPSLYNAACAKLLGPIGGVVDHDPDAAKDDPVQKRERVKRTQVAYRILFEQEAPDDLWRDIAPAPGPGSCQIFVKMIDGKTATFEVNLEEAVSSLMLRIEDMTGIPTDDQRLIWDCKNLEPGRTFSSYKIGKEKMLHLCLRLRGC